MIDSIGLKSVASELLGEVLEDTSLLKVFDDQASFERLQQEFQCCPVNVLVCQKKADKVDYTSSVLRQSDFRIRPIEQE